MQNKKYIILWIICLLGTLFHASFLHLNDILKVADSFAYLQMSHFLQNLSQQGLWNGWFWFLYSVPISFMNMFFQDVFFAAKIVNLILLNISVLLLWKIARKYLNDIYSFLVIILFFLSPTFLHFNIHVLSENIYIPLFLWLFVTTSEIIWNYSSRHTQEKLFRSQAKNIALLWIIIALMYLTRAEAFIYIWSIGILSCILLWYKRIHLKYFIMLWWIFFISFIIFISPYLFFLHSLTWEWGLTNKWASNLRQAELRGQEKMDDEGFEQAVAELTKDNHYLISGFAGGMPYVKPRIEWSLREYITKDFTGFTQRIWDNQIKLWSHSLPEIFLGKSPSLYNSSDSRFSDNILFLVWCVLPLIILVFWTIKIFQKEKIFLTITLSFFLPASIFFTLFFTLNRYYLIFLPLLIILYSYGVANITWKYKKIISIFLIINIISIFLLSTLVYYNTEKNKDEYYALKKEAGMWLQKVSKSPQELKILERFPIVTYYSGSKTRYITPYTENINDIYEYALYNNIEYLVVDTMDFLTYRPQLSQYIIKIPGGFSLLKEFSNMNWQKVILYQVKK